MASRRRSKIVDTIAVKVNSTASKRAKSSRIAKRTQESKLLSEQKTTTKKVFDKPIEKLKLNEDKKPHVERAKDVFKEPKQRKIHKCAICLKIFKGMTSTNKMQLIK